MTAGPFGLDPVLVLSVLLAGTFIGWTITLYLYLRTIRHFHLSNFWWKWWVETAVRHGIVLEDDDLAAARELAPTDKPPIPGQVAAVTNDPDKHFQGEVDP